MSGAPVESPVFSFQRRAVTGSRVLHAREIILVEGMFAHEHFLGLSSDATIFLDARLDLVLARRLKELSAIYTATCVQAHFFDLVVPSAQVLRRIGRRGADIYADLGADWHDPTRLNGVCLQQVEATARALLGFAAQGGQ